MHPNKQRQIASMGGKKAHALGKAHKWTSAEARKAGQLGVVTTLLSQAATYHFV